MIQDAVILNIYLYLHSLLHFVFYDIIVDCMYQIQWLCILHVLTHLTQQCYELRIAPLNIKEPEAQDGKISHPRV